MNGGVGTAGKVVGPQIGVKAELFTRLDWLKTSVHRQRHSLQVA